MTATDSPRIYVACLSAYNNGKLHGAWIDATQDPEDIESDVLAMLAKSPEPGAEEWSIHDYDNFQGAKLGESDSFDKVSELAQILAEHGAAYVAYMGCVGDHYATKEGFEESYRGQYDSPEAFAEEWTEECGDLDKVPESLRRHIDFESVAREMECSGFSFVRGDGAFYVFID